MEHKTLIHSSYFPLQIPNPHTLSLNSISTRISKPHSFSFSIASKSRLLSPNHLNSKFISTACSKQEITASDDSAKSEELVDKSIWKQIKEIVMFSGPATGLWICGPLMSLIDTAVIGQGSSIELAALGPGTVLCDNMSYVFMFISIATTNMVATSLARRDKNEVQHQISMLLFIGLTSGILMLFFTRFSGSWALTTFTGPKNGHLVPAANTYVQIRGLAWPALLVGWVTQSASLGMKDSWGPLKALAMATLINGVGDVVLCSLLGYGIAGAAWATMVSQVVAAYMMIKTLNEKGYNAFSISIPSPGELVMVFQLAAPVFVSLISKVGFYTLIVYFATSMGTQIVAAHQAQLLLKSLMLIGALCGFAIGIIGVFVPRFYPTIFTPDPSVIREMHKILLPFFLALAITPCTHSLEGTLLAGRDLQYISLSMSVCFFVGTVLLWIVSSNGFGLQGCWCALVGFQWARFFLALQRLTWSGGIFHPGGLHSFNVGKLKTR